MVLPLFAFFSNHWFYNVICIQCRLSQVMCHSNVKIIACLIIWSSCRLISSIKEQINVEFVQFRNYMQILYFQWEWWGLISKVRQYLTIRTQFIFVLFFFICPADMVDIYSTASTHEYECEYNKCTNNGKTYPHDAHDGGKV